VVVKAGNFVSNEVNSSLLNVGVIFLLGCGGCELICLVYLGCPEKEGQAKEVLFFSFPSKNPDGSQSREC